MTKFTVNYRSKSHLLTVGHCLPRMLILSLLRLLPPYPDRVKPEASEQQQYSAMGIVFVMFGSFSFSCMFLLAKLLQGEANSFTLVFYRSLVQVAVSLSAVLRNGENPLGSPEARGWLLIRGGFGSGAVIAFFYAIQHLPLPDAVTLQFTTPPFAAAFAVCFAGEKWMKLDMVGAIVCILGVMLIAHPSWLFGLNEEQNNDGTVDLASDTSMSATAILLHCWERHSLEWHICPCA